MFPGLRDSSPHDGFEGCGSRDTLIVFIDDATSRLLALRFFRSETTEAYMETLPEHLAAHGRSAALYSDRYSVLQVNRKERKPAPPSSPTPSRKQPYLV